MDQFLINWIESLIETHITNGSQLGKISHTTINKEYSYDSEYSGSNGAVTLTLETSYVLKSPDDALITKLNSFEKAFNAQRENIENTYANNIATAELKNFTNQFNKGVGHVITTEFKYETFQ